MCELPQFTLNTLSFPWNDPHNTPTVVLQLFHSLKSSSKVQYFGKIRQWLSGLEILETDPSNKLLISKYSSSGEYQTESGSWTGGLLIN